MFKQTSALVWEMCDGNRSVNEISKGLSKKLNKPANEDLVWLALDQLKKEKLIESEVNTPAAFEGMNRRDVIKKVGLATMIALPLVTGLVAPKAIHAASTRFAGAVTVSNGTCAANTTSTSRNNSCQALFGASCPSGNATNTSVTPSCTDATPPATGYSFGCNCA